MDAGDLHYDGGDDLPDSDPDNDVLLTAEVQEKGEEILLGSAGGQGRGSVYLGNSVGKNNKPG